MKVQHLRWDGFRVPFATPFGTSRSTNSYREGLLLRITTDDGLIGWGEISPLPEFDGSTIPLAVSALRKWSPHLIGVEIEAVTERIASLADEQSGLSPVRCGFDVAALDVMARRSGKSIADLLGGVRREMAVNATIGTADSAAAVTAAREAVSRGFSCIKLKVGLARTATDEIERVAAVRQAIGEGIRLRLDANGAWSTLEAIKIIGDLAEFHLELVEQPVSAGDIDGLRQVRDSVPVPVAADEAVATFEQARRVVASRSADVLVIKPMVVGGLRPARQIVELARGADLGVIVTTTIDTGIGVAAAMHLATTLVEPTLACGLATGPLLASDLLVQPLSVDRGTMVIPDEPGLGVSIHLGELARYASGLYGEFGRE